MTKKVSTDIGGTFTDIAVYDEEGNIHVFKSPTTPDNYSEGVIGAVEVAAKFLGESTFDLLKESDRFVHGSTITTNAILEGKVGKVGLICTRGHRDILTIREGAEKSNPYQWKIDYAEPYVPRYLTMEVTERISSEGEVLIPLKEEDVRNAVRKLMSYDVEAIAVSLLWDIANAVHSNRIKEIIREENSDIPIVQAHDLNPTIRELKRTSSTVINASLIPVVDDYFEELQHQVTNNGYTGDLSILNCTGGVMSVEEMLSQPIYTVDSGPTMAPVMGLEVAMLEKGESDIIVVDMGGTSFDISTVTDGMISQSRDTKIRSYDLGIAKADIKTVGSGGGSIASVDNGGMLHVGPESAGATPGPACYGNGGELPTVTDANLILGLLNENFYNGGAMELYPELAEKAIMKHVGEPLNLTLREAAFSIWHTVNSNMSASIEEVTIWKGVDPREYLLVAGGGAAGLHIAQICKQLNVKQAIIPRVAGALSAAGGIFADIVGNYSIGNFVNTMDFDFESVNKTLSELTKSATDFLNRSNVPKNKRVIEFYCEARYPFQITELSIPLRISNFEGETSIKDLVNDFHNEHERVFGTKEDTFIECVNWRARAIGEVDKKEIAPLSNDSSDILKAKIGERDIFLGPENGLMKAQVFRGDKLPKGSLIPYEEVAIIEDATTTFLSLPGCQVQISEHGNYLLDFKN